MARASRWPSWCRRRPSCGPSCCTCSARAEPAVRTLVTVDGQLSEVSADDITRRLLADEGEFWLDVERPEDADYDLLLDAFGFHPLTVEDVRQQNQRPKLVQFAGYAFAVLFTITLRDDQMDFREHHLYLSKRCLVSVHQEPAPALEDLRRRIRESPELTRGEGKFLQYLVANALVESLFPTLDGIDVTIDELEDGIVQRATPATLIRLTTLRHQVSDLRRVVSPQREV